MSSATYVLPVQIIRNILRVNARCFSAAPPPPPSISSTSSQGPPLGTLRMRNLGTQVTPLVIDDSSSFTHLVETLIDKHVLEEISLKSIMEQNPEVQKFVIKIVTAKENSKKTEKDQRLGKHPFVNVASNLFFQDEDYPINPNMPGALVYLVGKLFGGGGNEIVNRKIIHLSKCVNQSAAAFQIHRTVQEDSGAVTGNKLATLAGDLLVVETIKNAASIGDNEIFLWIMNSLGEFSLTEFAPKDPRTGRSQDRITPEGSLLSTGFKGVAKMNSTSHEMIPKLERLGRAMGHLWIKGQQKDGLIHEEENRIAAEDALEIITNTFPDCDISRLLRDFVLFYDVSPTYAYQRSRTHVHSR